MKAFTFTKILNIASIYSSDCEIDFENKEIVGDFRNLQYNFNNHRTLIKKLGAELISSNVISF